MLVLGAGGVLGEAWTMGVLAGLEDAAGIDLRECEAFVGTSAGAIVAAHLAAGRPPRRPSAVSGTEIEPAVVRPSLPGPLQTAAAAGRRAGTIGQATAGMLAPLAFGLAAPGGALLRAALLSRVPPGPRSLSGLREQVDRSGARFDGRLRVVAVNRRTGRRVVFGTPGAPAADPGEAVAASSAVPWIFAPVNINGHDFVDGGVWSPTNLDVAPAGRDTQVLCLHPLGAIGARYTVGPVLRGAARAALVAEALVLRRRGAIVELVAPDATSREAIGEDFMSSEPRHRVAAAGYRQGLALAGGA